MGADPAPHFGALFDWLRVRVAASGARHLFASMRAESSDFVRFSRSRVRQSGHVTRARIRMCLIDAGRQCTGEFTASGNAGEDTRRFDAMLGELRVSIGTLDPDPLLAFDESPRKSFTLHAEAGDDIDRLTGTVIDAAGADDLVGLLGSGPRAFALASTLGHACYHERRDYLFDFSVQAGPRRAVKSFVSGTRATAAALVDEIARARAEVPRLALAETVVTPGRYRVWLAPRACADLVEMFGWSGLSEAALRTGQSPLARMREGAQLCATFDLAEAPAQSGAPRFGADGFERPDQLALITAGRLVGSLVSGRTAREFELASNGAGATETPDSLTLAPGALDDRDPAALVGDGILIGNLWYLNHSDRASARVTGMTRFGTYRVREGRALGPLAPMRFDDSLLRVFGEGLVGLGRTARSFAATDTYEERAWGATSAPGALVEGFELRL